MVHCLRRCPIQRTNCCLVKYITLMHRKIGNLGLKLYLPKEKLFPLPLYIGSHDLCLAKIHALQHEKTKNSYVFLSFINNPSTFLVIFKDIPSLQKHLPSPIKKVGLFAHISNITGKFSQKSTSSTLLP